MKIKKVFIEKGNTGLYYGKYIDEYGDIHPIFDAFQCLSKLGCKIAIKKWLREQNNIVYSCDID